MLSIVIVVAIGYVLSLGLFLQERSDLYKEIDSLKEDLIRTELHALNAQRDAEDIRNR